jgi:hypothetical protein
MTRNARARLPLIILAATLIGVILGIGWLGVSRVDARQLSAASDVTRRAQDLLGAGQILHFYVTVYQRTDPTLEEPPDPYHLPIIPLYRDKRVIERWLGLDTQVQIIKLAAEPDLILWKYVILPDRLLIYDGSVGTGATLPRNRKSPTQGERQSKVLESWLDGVRLSNWGRLAWVVRSQPISSLPAWFDTRPQKHLDQGPYAADLEFDTIQITEEIDQESGLLVSVATHALTPQGPVLIRLEEYSEPEILDIADLPQGWNELPINTVSLKEDQRTVPDSSPSLEAAGRNIPFRFFLPGQHLLDQFGFDRVDVLYPARQARALPSPLTFELYSAPALGLGVETIFSSSRPTDPEQPQAISLIQGPADEIIPFLRQSPPLWHNSRSLPVTLNQEEVAVWIVTGGLLRTDTNSNPMIGAAFELNETFVYVEVQNLSEKDLLAVLESLQPARPDQN